MPNAEAILSRWYAGEVGGEALFAQMAKQASPEAAAKWLVLARLEAGVASRLAETLSERGQPIPVSNDVARRARERCEAVAGKSWVESMQWLRVLAGSALQKMRTEATTAGIPYRNRCTGGAPRGCVVGIYRNGAGRQRPAIAAGRDLATRFSCATGSYRR